VETGDGARYGSIIQDLLGIGLVRRAFAHPFYVKIRNLELILRLQTTMSGLSDFLVKTQFISPNLPALLPSCPA
jgi:hypothetical protein